MPNTEYIRGYKNNRVTIESSLDEDKEWKAQHILELAESQNPMSAYDHGAFVAMTHFQNGIEWKY